MDIRIDSIDVRGLTGEEMQEFVDFLKGRGESIHPKFQENIDFGGVRGGSHRIYYDNFDKSWRRTMYSKYSLSPREFMQKHGLNPLASLYD